MLVSEHAKYRLFPEPRLHNGGESVTNLALKELQAKAAGGDTLPLHQQHTPIKTSTIVITGVQRVRLGRRKNRCRTNNPLINLVFVRLNYNLCTMDRIL